MEQLLARAKEPSTYAGLTGFLVSMNALGFTEGQWTTIWGAVSAIAAVAAMVLKEAGEPQHKKKKKK